MANSKASRSEDLLVTRKTIDTGGALSNAFPVPVEAESAPGLSTVEGLGLLMNYLDSQVSADLKEGLALVESGYLELELDAR